MQGCLKVLSKLQGLPLQLRFVLLSSQLLFLEEIAKSDRMHCLHWLLQQWWGQMLTQMHCLHWLPMRWCGQILAPMVACASSARVGPDCSLHELHALAPFALERAP